MLRRLATTAAATIVALASIATAHAQNKHVVIYPTPSTSTAPIWLGIDGGYFERYGVEIDAQFGVHPSGFAAVTAGDALTTNTGLDPAIAATAKSQLLVMVASPLNRGAFVLMGAKGIAKASDLAGKRIAVGRVGDPPYFYTIGLLRDLGIDPSGIQWIPAGAPPQRAATLQNGQSDATLITPPAYFKMEAQGFPVLANMAEHPNVIVATTYLFRRDTVEEKPDLVEAFLKATIEATKRFYDDKAFAVASMQKWIKGSSEDDISRIYDETVRTGQIERVPYILARAIDGVVERDSERLPELKTTDFSKVAQNQFLDKLVAEGFFEKVYGPSIKDEVAKQRADAYR